MVLSTVFRAVCVSHLPSHLVRHVVCPAGFVRVLGTCTGDRLRGDFRHRLIEPGRGTGAATVRTVVLAGAVRAPTVGRTTTAVTNVTAVTAVTDRCAVTDITVATDHTTHHAAASPARAVVPDRCTVGDGVTSGVSGTLRCPVTVPVVPCSGGAPGVPGTVVLRFPMSAGLLLRMRLPAF